MIPSDIVITTLNARYHHASLGLRYLLANMGELKARTHLREYVINERPIDIVEDLLSYQSEIIGFGVYIWNIEETTKIVALLKQVKPDICIVIGGPEVSYEYTDLPIAKLADHLITGAADLAFADLCRRKLAGDRITDKLIAAPSTSLNDLVMPYREYNDKDIAERFIYVEASRGCPFKCEFCLSALDKTAWPFDTARFLEEMRILYDRGARHFKFVDRTFNLNIAISTQILEFFLVRLDESLFLHFELIPDRLPEALKKLIVQFPPGSLQFEIGIQTFNPEVQALISRKQDNAKAEENLVWLRKNTHAHLHVDLIAGLPDEDLGSFAAGFDKLVQLDPHEIQVGILKRLRGTPIIRHTQNFDLRFNPAPPYTVLSTDCINFTDMQRINRFARFWDLIANSGRFKRTKTLLLGDSPFARFMRLSDWIFAQTRQTHQIAMDRLFDLVFDGSVQALGLPPEILRPILAEDYFNSGGKGQPKCLQGMAVFSPRSAAKGKTPPRQRRHLQAV
jgi:radical SAM superfamily enzyme YgiQ (UPF0313 family)